MAEVKIQDIIEHLDSEMKRAGCAPRIVQIR